MNQSIVPHEEIGVRLSICCEFLSDEKKPIEEAYESLMEKLGRKIMEYTEFEYWFKRFQNNQFDLGYDTSLDEKEISKIDKVEGGSSDPNLGYDTSQDSEEISEIQNTMDSEASEDEEDPVEVVKREMEDLKLDYPPAEECIKLIKVTLNPDLSTIFLGDTKIKLDHNGDSEKLIIDFLRSELENPNLSLNSFEMHNDSAHYELDFEKFKFLLQSMLKSIPTIHTSKFYLTGFDEDFFMSLLEHMEPGTLETISFSISWKNEGNHRKSREIVEMEQWKRAKTIHSYAPTSLRIRDVLHCESFTLICNLITPRDVVRLREYLLSLGPHSPICTNGKLLSKSDPLNINEFKSALTLKHRDSHRDHSVSYRYPLPDGKVLWLNINPHMVDFWRTDI